MFEKKRSNPGAEALVELGRRFDAILACLYTDADGDADEDAGPIDVLPSEAAEPPEEPNEAPGLASLRAGLRSAVTSPELPSGPTVSEPPAPVAAKTAGREPPIDRELFDEYVTALRERGDVRPEVTWDWFQALLARGRRRGAKSFRIRDTPTGVRLTATSRVA